MVARYQSELDRLLPSGDPTAPFDPGLIVASARTGESNRACSDPVENAELRQSELQPRKLPLQNPATKSPVARPTQRRRNRDRSLIIAMLGALGVLACAIGFLLLVLNRMEPTDRLARSVESSSQVAGQDNRPVLYNSASSGVRRSGLPPVPTIPEEPVEESSNGHTEQPAHERELADIQIDQKPPSMDDRTKAEERSFMGEETAETESILSQNDRQKWQQSVVEVRGLLREFNFAESKKQLINLASLAKTRRQKDQLTRLSTIASLVEGFRESLAQSIGGLSAGESFAVAGREVSFVQSNHESVVIRDRGRNMTYLFTELPIALAYGIVDLDLPLESPQSKAAKAAFAATRADTSQAALAEARRWLQESAAARHVPADTAQFIDDLSDTLEVHRPTSPD